jgi:hypothetical protein
MKTPRLSIELTHLAGDAERRGEAVNRAGQVIDHGSQLTLNQESRRRHRGTGSLRIINGHLDRAKGIGSPVEAGQ